MPMRWPLRLVRGPDHLNTECLAEFGGSPEARQLIKRITGSEEYAYPHTTEKRAEIVRWHEDIYGASDALGFAHSRPLPSSG